MRVIAQEAPATRPPLGSDLDGAAITGCLQGLFIGVAFAVGTSIAPAERMGWAISTVFGGVFLLAYGLANAAGTFVGGRAADRNASPALAAATIVLVAALGLLYLGGAAPALVVIALVVWGPVGFSLVPSLQYRVVSLAGPGGDLAATLPASAVTGGIAVGSRAGDPPATALRHPAQPRRDYRDRRPRPATRARRSRARVRTRWVWPDACQPGDLRVLDITGPG
jgi:hypothetical protein